MTTKQTTLAEPLRAIVDALLSAAARDSRAVVSLDELASAIGTRAVSQDEIDAMIEVLEAAGQKVESTATGKASDHLRAVLSAARALAPELGRRATTAEIAARAGLTLEDVRHALALAKVMQR